MSSKKANKLKIVPYFLYYLYVITDASMPECRNAFDKCQCHKSYKHSNKKEMDEDQKTTKVCLKLYSSSQLSWEDADNKCKTEFSYLMFNYSQSATLEDFNEDADLVWIGIRKLSGFYINLSNYPSLFEESNKWGRKWARDEPIHECVALDLYSGSLVTRSCTTQLPFVCQNKGFPVYPIANSVACPKDWFIYYHNDLSMKSCIRAFKRLNDRQNLDQECENVGGKKVEVDDYIKLYSYISGLKIKGFTRSICGVDKYIESVFGGPLRVLDTELTCSDKMYICESDYRNISLTIKILPEVLDPVYSTHNNSTTFTCGIFFNDTNLNKVTEELLFKWYKDGIPTSGNDNALHLNSSSMINQGSYHCEVRIEGIQGTYLSTEVPYFHSDVSTYILTLQGELIYEDFSKSGFRNTKPYLNELMAAFTSGELSSVANLKWNLQKTWFDGNATVQVLLFFKRNESLDINLQEEVEFYNIFLKYTKEKQKTEGRFNRISLELQSAVICFEESALSAETSYDDILLWKDTVLTNSAISEPMCLNGWRLVTRRCKPSTIEGAKWLPFDYSMCTNYQLSIPDKIFNCPPGLKELESNICYNVFTEKLSFEDAKQMCNSRSSFLMDLKLFNNNKILSELETSSKYWFSERTSSVESKIKTYSYHKIIHPNFHCKIINLINGTLVHSFDNCKIDEKHAFVCIHHPLILLETRLFSKPWNKFPLQQGCFYIEHSKKTWDEANKSCQLSLRKSYLLQSIQNRDDYASFKTLLYSLPQLPKGTSWWISLFQDNDSLKWLNSPNEIVNFVDWEAHTNFGMNQSAGILTQSLSTKRSIHWSLKDLSSEEGFICEMQDCTDSSPVTVDIHDLTLLLNESDSDLIQTLSYQCLPKGWYVAGSISWFKDYNALKISDYISSDLSLHMETGPTVNDSLRSQGYYWCSVDQELYTTQVFSPKVLFKHPGWDTFVLYMVTKVPEFSNCSHLLSQKAEVILEFNNNVHDFLSHDNLFLYFKDATCTGSELHFYNHIYVSKKMESSKVNEFFKTFTSQDPSSLMDILLKKLDVNNEGFSLRSTVACPSEESHDGEHILTWPETPIGHSASPKENCFTEEGHALKRKCLGDFNTGGFWSSMEKSCAHFQSLLNESALTVTLRELAKENITESNVLNSSLSMEVITSHYENFSTTDVKFVARILQNIASVPDIQPEIVRSVVATVNIVIDVNIQVTDGSLTTAPDKISSALEDILSNVQTNGQVISEAGNNIAVSALPFNTNSSLIPAGGVLQQWGSNVTTLFNDSNKNVGAQLSQFENFEAAVILPDNLLSQKQNANVTNIPIIIRRNFHFLSDVKKDVKVISPVIAVSLGKEPVYNVNPPVEMIFNISEVIGKDSKSIKCVFWVENQSIWSDVGCYSRPINFTRVHCFCDHLTSFAIIVDLNVELGGGSFHDEILSIITYIACCLSIFGLGLIILTFIMFRKWRSYLKHKVLFNLSLSLLLFLFVFLIGAEKKHWNYGCMAIAILLHYSLLTTFAWMLVEAYLQYLRLVKVVGTYIPRFLQKAMLFGWGLPFVIVGIVLSINHMSYSDNDHKYCLLTGKFFYFAVAVPALSMLALIFIIFGLILYSNTCGRSKEFLRTNQDERKELIARAKAVFGISILLGLSWLFGFLALSEAKIVFQYLFTITTAPQGFFIFYFFLFRQKGIRDEWVKILKLSSSSDSSNTGGTGSSSTGTQSKRSHNKVVYNAGMPYVSIK